MSTELQTLNDKQVIQRATEHKGSRASWMATDELTRRALEDEHLWDTAFAVIGGDRTINLRYIPYGCHLAVARILDSGNKRMIRRLLQEMDRWTAYEQQDAIGPWAGYKRIAEATRELQDRYGWSPKYMVAL